MQTLHNETSGNNESVEKLGAFAGFFPRLIAFAIDSLIASLGVALIKGIFLSGLNQWDILTNAILFNYSVMDILTWVMKVSYFVIAVYCTQTTLGKYLMKLKVVGAESEQLTLFQIIYRETAGRFLSSFFYIGYLIIIADKQKAALHDRLADTRVVYSCNVKVTKKVVVTKVWNTQPVVQNSVQQSEVQNPAQQTDRMQDPVVEQNVTEEVQPTVAEQNVTEEVQPTVVGQNEIEEVQTTDVEASAVEENVEEDVKKDNEVI